MIHVVVGTDSYGRVKTVGKTAIVTTFSMVEMLPVGPIKSYYVWGRAESETSGIPFFAVIQKVQLRGLSLARVDWTSVAFAYIRAVLAALVLFGFIGTFMGLIFSANGKPMDDFALTATRLAEGCLATGVAGGVLTYLIPTVSRRERAIRSYCGEILGVSIDPGRLVPDVAEAVRGMLAQPMSPDQPGVAQSRADCLRKLILTRCDIATEAGSDCEVLTDELLEQLWHFDRVEPARSVDDQPSDGT